MSPPLRPLRKRHLSVAVGFALATGALFGNAAPMLQPSAAPFAAVIPLSTLNGSNGFRLDGAASFEGSGSAVEKAGDVNGDGYADLIVGAPGANSFAGRACVVFGRKGGFASALDLSALNGSNGFCLDGDESYARAGTSVGGGGDINGDGFDDIVIGEPQFSSTDTRAGAVFVVFGHSGPFSSLLDLSALNGTNGYRITGAAAYDEAGSAVALAGDIDGDGFDDLLVGAPGAAPGGRLYAGSAFVVFGHGGTFASSLNLSSINGTNGFRLDGVNAYDSLGRSLAAAGDVNGDHFDDVIVGAYKNSSSVNYAGSSYVVFGHSGAFASALNASALNGSNGFRLAGATEYGLSGASVAGVGDVNGDGFDDVLVGQPITAALPVLDSSGRSYVVFGHGGSFGSSLSLSALNGTNGFRLDGPAYSYSGSAVAAAGDVDGDGFADVLIGAYGTGDYNGSAYVVFGHGGAYPSSLDLTALDGASGFRMDGGAGNDRAGSAVAGVGDLNRDGADDVLVGAAGADPHGASGAGSSYLVFGRVPDRVFADSFEGP